MARIILFSVLTGDDDADDWEVEVKVVDEDDDDPLYV